MHTPRQQQPASRVEPVTDVLHGQSVVDPYRWLEDPDSPETRSWIDEQNAYTRGLLDAIPGRDALRRRLQQLLSIGTITAPVVRGDLRLYLRRSGNQNQPVLIARRGDDAGEQVLLDPNAEDAAGTTALDWWQPSWDGRLLAYGYSQNGDEWSTLRVLETDGGRVLPDSISRTRYASVAWLPDASGLYYTRYPNPGEVPAGDENYNQRLFFHELGSDPREDTEVHIANLDREDLLEVLISADGRYLIANVYKGTQRSDVYLCDRSNPDRGFVPVAVGHTALFSAQMAGGTLFLHTNLDAPRYRLIAVDPVHPDPDRWRTVVPESDAVLEQVALVNGGIVAAYLRNASSEIVRLDVEGRDRRPAPLPATGSVFGITGEWDNPDVFYGFHSFTIPPCVYRLDPSSGRSELWERVPADVQADRYVVEQDWHPSRDGTHVSMFIVRARDVVPDRPRPTLLYGYGGFNVNETPAFSRGIYAWLERGGIYVVANLRGGAEYGETWHRDGMLERKQNVFDDFASAAEHLIERGYTDSDHLAIHGGSNGGLLVGAAVTQRPELFRAAVCSVPLLDMLRYHLFLIGRLWIPEYGSAEDPEQFRYLYAYSPYHHVRPGEHYPAILFETADSDTRVEPLHARKMAASMQAANASDRPVLIRIETRAGHGIGKPMSKVLDEQTDRWSFLFWQLGMAEETAEGSQEGG